ncbi:unnamed protein product, partial [Laminaria digitata]
SSSGRQGGGGGPRPSPGPSRVAGASPASSSGSLSGTPRDLLIASLGAGSGPRQPGTPLSVGLMSMRSRLIKRWNSTLIGT